MRWLKRDYHGGKCCGAHHLFGFDEVVGLQKEERRKEVEEDIDEIMGLCTTQEDSYEDEEGDWIDEPSLDLWDEGSESVACEGMIALQVTLTDRQLANYDGWLRVVMATKGFKKVFRWQNPNTGAFVNMFVLGQEAPDAV